MVATNQTARFQKKKKKEKKDSCLLYSSWYSFRHIHSDNIHTCTELASFKEQDVSQHCDSKNAQARWAQPSEFLPEDVKMQEAGESLTTVACSASTMSGSHWSWDNFNKGKIIHPATDLTSEAGAMKEVSVSHRSPTEAQSRRNWILQICAVLHTTAELQVWEACDGKLQGATSGFISTRMPRLLSET